MNSHRQALTKVVIHRAPVRVMTLLGGEHHLVIMHGLFCCYLMFLLSFRYNIFVGCLAGLNLWLLALFIFRKMAQADPQMSKIFMRHIRYKAFYPARGRFNAPQKYIHDFK